MLEAGLVALVTAASAITDLIGSNLYDTVAPEQLTNASGQSIYPCLTYQVVSYTKAYGGTADAGVAEKRIVWTAFSPQNSDVRNIREALRQLLTGYGGTLSDGTVVYFTEIVAQHDDFSADSRMFRATLHAKFSYAE